MDKSLGTEKKQCLDYGLRGANQATIQPSLHSYISALETLLRHAKEVQSAALFNEPVLSNDVLNGQENLFEWDQRK